jgi:hypothetical protein
MQLQQPQVILQATSWKVLAISREATSSMEYNQLRQLLRIATSLIETAYVLETS